MSSLHLPTIDQHILDLPHSISDKAIWFWENFQGVYVNSLFSIYDPILKSSLDAFFQAWQRALSHVGKYHSTPNGANHIFTNPGDMPLRGAKEAAWEEINDARNEMRGSLDQILTRLRESYIEVKLFKSNAKAWKTYLIYNKEVKHKKIKKK